MISPCVLYFSLSCCSNLFVPFCKHVALILIMQSINVMNTIIVKTDFKNSFLVTPTKWPSVLSLEYKTTLSFLPQSSFQYLKAMLVASCLLGLSLSNLNVLELKLLFLNSIARISYMIWLRDSKSLDTRLYSVWYHLIDFPQLSVLRVSIKMKIFQFSWRFYIL